jgi:uncharacterized protein
MELRAINSHSYDTGIASNNPKDLRKSNMKIPLNSIKYSIIIILLSLLVSCGRSFSPQGKKYISEIEQQRKEKDDYMKNDPQSPFNFKSKVHFENLKYYDVNPDYVFKSKLYEFKNKDTIKIFGTKGEERKAVKVGYVKINFSKSNPSGRNQEENVNVYKGVSKTGEEYYSIWFTDKTTNNETYGVGRYLDFEPAYIKGTSNLDTNFVYTIDFNLAYNPYCSYSSMYSCAIPTKDDHIDVAIEAGEKKFH